jgi:hypothetical protein
MHLWNLALIWGKKDEVYNAKRSKNIAKDYFFFARSIVMLWL